VFLHLTGLVGVAPANGNGQSTWQDVEARVNTDRNLALRTITTAGDYVRNVDTKRQRL